jgi:diaminopimelate decarboxylase
MTVAADALALILDVTAGQAPPFYLYEAGEVRRMAARFADLPWHDKAIHVATMANDHEGFLRVVREAGLKVFVNSLQHLECVRRTGFRGREIVFTASAMDTATMRTVQEAGALVNLDSLGEVATWHRLFPGAPAGIRCNIGGLVEPRGTRAGFFLGRESRLGLLPDEIERLYGEPWVEALHLYVGTDILDVGYFRECYEQLARLAVHFPGLRYLDFGGGFGVAADGEPGFDFDAYGEMIAAVMADASRRVGRPLTLLLEPGRIVGASAGHFVTRVVDIKQRGERQLVGVNASVAQFPRPLFYPDNARHPVVLLPAGAPTPGDGAPVPTDVYGCSTYSRDYLARDVLLPRARPGDLVVFGLAGAYCASAHTGFLGFPRPPEIMA